MVGVNNQAAFKSFLLRILSPKTRKFGIRKVFEFTKREIMPRLDFSKGYEPLATNSKTNGDNKLLDILDYLHQYFFQLPHSLSNFYL